METLTLPDLLRGRLPEQDNLSADLDYYKPTMSQLHFEKHPEAEVTFTFRNRGSERLADYIEPEVLQARFDYLRERNWQPEELHYYAGLLRKDGTPVFSDKFLIHLRENTLPEIEVRLDPETNDLAIETTGESDLVTYWETIVMSEINEMYFENYMIAHNINPQDLYEEGDRRLSEKIKILKENPDIKFSDFGTRRRFSYRWHRYVVERLSKECPDNFLGTSNVQLSRLLNKTPIGTFAHELPMIYAGLADARGEDIRPSHNKCLRDWQETYPDLLIALMDTYTSEFFFVDFTRQQAEDWTGPRQDSGDPFEIGEQVISFYKRMGIDPTTKSIVFSDGLDMQTILKLHKHFKGRIGMVFGWGTTLTNDLGLKPLNIVMKATHVRLPDGREADLVKISDDEGKHTGPDWLVKLYKRIFKARYDKEVNMVTC